MTRHQTPFTRPVGATRSAPANERPRQIKPSAPSAARAAPAGEAGAFVPEHEPATGPVTQTTSEALFAGAVEIQIDHQGTIYRLKHTALGKLILTK